ncbi:MAG: hypothetical protein MJZ89_05640, partial [Paludibacteraceae bacterium]|nr:hypothetical protein [Paludibacteraceae bacterium]
LLGVRSEQSLKGVLPGDSIVCTIRNVHIADDNVPEIIITGDKLYPNETVPFEAHIEATETSLSPSIPPSAEVHKYIRNGLLFIERNGELFDLLGRPL